MPRQSAAAMSVVKLEQQRPKAPPGLPEHGAALWNDICASYPPGHFAAGDLPLLDNYIRCVLILDKCNESLGEDGIFSPDGMKAHPAIDIRDKQLKAMASLATKLRLPVSSRIRPDSASTRPTLSGPKPWQQ